VNISSAIFHCSAPGLDLCPDESLPEFAFIGRSNVGKSPLARSQLRQERNLCSHHVTRSPAPSGRHIPLLTELEMLFGLDATNMLRLTALKMNPNLPWETVPKFINSEGVGACARPPSATAAPMQLLQSYSPFNPTPGVARLHRPTPG
jgi:hypothetical protein